MVTDGKETCGRAQLAMYANIKSLLCTPEAKVLYVSYTSVKNTHTHTYSGRAQNETGLQATSPEETTSPC